MKQYFDFTPYITDTPVSFTITDGPFMDFICDQLTVENIPFTKDVHMRKLDDGGPIEGTDLIAPPSQTFSYAIITAPLSQKMITRLEINSNPLELSKDNAMDKAYITWYKDVAMKDIQWD